MSQIKQHGLQILDLLVELLRPRSRDGFPHSTDVTVVLAFHQVHADLLRWSHLVGNWHVELIRHRVAHPDTWTVEEFEGKDGLHWWLRCVLWALPAEEQATHRHVVVTSVLEDAKLSLVC